MKEDPSSSLLPVVNSFLWVKHLFFLYTSAINIAVVVVHVVFHCFIFLVNCYLNP